MLFPVQLQSNEVRQINVVSTSIPSACHSEILTVPFCLEEILFA